MHFSKILQEDEVYNIIECTKLDNNILVYRKKIDENAQNLVKLKDKQNAMLFEKGQVLDIVKDEGIYTISNALTLNFSEDLSDYKIKDNSDKLCVIFFNMDIIKNNKFYIKKKRKNSLFGEGIFDFQIENPVKLFNKVIQVRNYYSREELIEQIRERISKIVISAIKENSKIGQEYINASLDVFKEYGIKIVASDIKNINFKRK